MPLTNGFRDGKQLFRHFQRHRSEFGVSTAGEYLDLADAFLQYLRQFLAKHSAALYLAVKSVVQSPDVGGEMAIQDFGEGIVGEEDKIPSLISIFNKIQVPGNLQDQNAQAGIQWSLVSSWIRFPEDIGKSYEQRTRVIFPDGKESGEAIIPFQFSDKNHRNTVRIFGFPIFQEGIHIARLSIRESGNDQWTDVADYPIEVVHLHPEINQPQQDVP